MQRGQIRLASFHLSLGPRQTRQPLKSLPARALIALGLLVAVATSCTEDLDQRAVQPGAVSGTPTELPDVGVGGLRTPDTSINPSNERDLGLATGRQRFYFINGSDLWQQPVDNLAAPVVTGRDILAFSSSPDGEQVAIVYQSENAENHFAVINADSTQALELKPQSSDAGAVNPLDRIRTIAWSPEGLAIAVAQQDGSVYVVSADGTVRTLVAPGHAQSPAQLSWSPDGQFLAFLDPALPNEPTRLFIVPADGGPVRELVTTDDATSAVQAMSWLPGRAAIAYVRRSAASIEAGGDLFAVDTASGAQQLLVPSTQFAPVAGVLDLSASPDGQYLAWTVYVPGEHFAVFQSLWLMNLDTEEVIEVPTNTGEAITDLWWADHQLFFRSIPHDQMTIPSVYTGTESFQIYARLPETGTVESLYRSGN